MTKRYFRLHVPTMNVKQEILEEVVDFRVCRTNTPTEQGLDLPGIFPNGVCHDVTKFLLRNSNSDEWTRTRDESTREINAINLTKEATRQNDQLDEQDKLTTVAGLETNKEQAPENHLECEQNEEDDEGDGNDKNDGDEECEMILGDIPDVTIPPVLQKYAARLRTNSSSAKGKSKRNRAAALPVDGESPNIAAQSSENPVGQTTTASATPSRRYACRKCSLIFSKLEFLEAHMARLHPVVGPFRCTECPFESKYHSMLLLHLKEPHAPDARKENLRLKKVKLAQRNRLPRMKCPLCTYEAGSLAQFTSHSRVTHRNAFEKEVHRNIHNNKHGCPFRPSCSFQTTNRDTLEYHYKIEHKQRLWHCPECDFYTVWRVALNRHIKAHRENPAYTCDGCGRKFPIKSYLSRHRATSCERVQQPTVQAQPSDSVNDGVSSSSIGSDVASMKTSGGDSLSSEQSAEAPLSASSSGDRRPRVRSSSHKDSSKPFGTINTKNTVSATESSEDPQLKHLFVTKAATHCANGGPSRHNADCSSRATAGAAASHATLLAAQTPVSQSPSITTNPDEYSAMRQDLSPLWNISLSPKSSVEETLNALRNHSTMSPDLQVPSGSKDASKDFEIIDLTDDSISYENNLRAAAAPLKSSRKTETCYEQKSILSRHGSLSSSHRSLSSCKAAPSSVTIVWDSGKTAMENPTKAKTVASSLQVVTDCVSKNSIKTTFSGQMRAIDGQHCLGSTSVDEISSQVLDFTVRKKPKSFKCGGPSNTSVGSVGNLRESSSPNSCDTGLAASVGPIIISGYREASPPPLVIDDGALSD